jgi:hypothetical protein
VARTAERAAWRFTSRVPTSSGMSLFFMLAGLFGSPAARAPGMRVFVRQGSRPADPAAAAAGLPIVASLPGCARLGPARFLRRRRRGAHGSAQSTGPRAFGFRSSCSGRGQIDTPVGRRAASGESGVHFTPTLELPREVRRVEHRRGPAAARGGATARSGHGLQSDPS